MSWSQAFRDEAMADGRSFFDTDSHLLFHRKKVSSALKGIDRSSWYYPIVSFTAVSLSTPRKGMSPYIKWTVLLYFSNLFSMPCIMKWSSKGQQTFLKQYWNAVFDSAFTKKFSEKKLLAWLAECLLILLLHTLGDNIFSTNWFWHSLFRTANCLQLPSPT